MTTRRDALALPLALGAVTLAGSAVAAAPAAPSASHPNAHDWDWLAGSWRVRHHRLKGRLAGSTEWEHFDGTCVMWPTLGGLGNIDDNWLDIPSGAYKAVGIRAFDSKTGQWSIWWLDGRYPASIEPPVRGGFKDGVGEFKGDDVLNGKPIVVRFRWSDITRTSARWEQAFSPDGGKTWEVNWRMEFTRA